MKLSFCLRLILLFASSASLSHGVDFKKQIVPIFNQKCYACHSIAKGKTKGDVALDTTEELTKQIGPGKAIIPGEAAKSTLAISCGLPDDDEDVMPPKGKNRLTPPELALLNQWIQEGANLTGGAASAPAASPSAPAPATAGGPQKWTNAAGTVIEAEFQGLQGDNVLLKVTATGVTHAVPLSSLSPESQAQAKAAK